MALKCFKYKGYNITIKSYKDSWDKKITIKKGKYKSSIMYSLKYMSDAIKAAKNSIDSRIKPPKIPLFNRYKFKSKY